MGNDSPSTGNESNGYLRRLFGETDASGGEWQRLALARAFFRDADLLVFDEPTAALDAKAELALFRQFIDIAEGRTAIMTSHRLGTPGRPGPGDAGRRDRGGGDPRRADRPRR